MIEALTRSATTAADAVLFRSGNAAVADSVLFRAASLTPDSANDEARTVRATITTGAPVKRSLWGETWTEILDINQIRTADVVGLAVVDSHNIMTTEAIRGVVLDAGKDGAGIWADMRIDDDATWAKIKAGSLRSISIGYQVAKWAEVRTGDENLLQRTAIDWRIIEVSLVVIPADSAAKIRSALMTTEQTAAPAVAATNPPGAVAATVDTVAAPAVETRAVVTAPVVTPATTVAPASPAAPLNRAAINQEIRTIAATAGMDQAWIDSQIDAGATAELARSAAWEAMTKRQAPPVSTVHLIQDHTDPDAIRSRMADAVVARATYQPPPDHAREFMHFRVADMLIQLANVRGAKLDVRNHIGAVEHLFTRAGAISTSDFPLLLQDAGNKILLPRYLAAAPSYRLFSALRSFTDFKSHKFLRLGDFPALQEISEAGETKYGSVSENRETITAKEYGSGLSIGRRALINDDLSAFSDFTAMIGMRVAHDENSLVYALIASNGPTMADTVALFDASAHGNKASSATTVDVTNVGIAVAAMRNQTSLDGIKLNIAPKFLVVGTARELVARQLLTAVQATQTDKVNPYAGAFVLVVDANNAGNRWMMFADPAMLPTVVYGYVNGATGPQIRSEIDFDTRALKVAVGLDFACGVIDHRGAFLNAGG